MQVSEPGTTAIVSGASTDRARLLDTSKTANVEALQSPVSPPDKADKNKIDHEEPTVDIGLRQANAEQMAAEINVQTVIPKCIVHKGPISGYRLHVQFLWGAVLPRVRRAPDGVG